MDKATSGRGDVPPLVGLDVVGRGVHLRPRQSYGLRPVLFPQENWGSYTSRETGVTYRLPAGYAVNDSPPMPGDKALNQIIIEESWGRFDKRMSADAKLTAGSGPIKIDIHGAQLSQVRSEEESYYAVRASCVPLWTVYLPDITRLPAETFDLDIPTPFSPAHRQAYARFFERFGTHVVRRAWVGGQANLVFTVSKSTGLGRDQIQLALNTSVGGSSSSKAEQTRQSLLANSSCTVLGKGGDELALAALSSLDEGRYNAWLGTVKSNPQVIDMEVQGIWTLLDDAEKANALQAAYHEAYTFPPIASVFHYDRRIWFLRNDEVFSYDLDAQKSSATERVRDRWPALAGSGFERSDASVVTGREGQKAAVLHLFRRDRVIALDPKSGVVAEGYPRRLSEAWIGVPFDRVDAAVCTDDHTVYLFCGQRYARFDARTGKMDPGYPQSVPERWQGLHYDRIDGAIYWGSGKVYFFVGDQYIRYDMVTCRTDPGYPRYLQGQYVEDWRFFD